jgi:ribulose-phosphate 3-epimerase
VVVLIAPSILSADFMNLEKEIRAVERSGADMLHLDVMDGHFVPNLTIGPEIVKQIRHSTKMTLDVHLMIENPDRYLDVFMDAGADILTVHAEAAVHLHRTIQMISAKGKKAGVSLNPATPLWHLELVLSYIDMVLIMSVNPGFGGQSFILETLNKIKALRKMVSERGLTTHIEVDGGIKISNAREVADAGADILVMGSGFFAHDDYGGLVRRFRESVGR